MPSKSKSQARFFAAAAHNPDFAKKAGVSTKAAKEWNKADEKAGTLKKGSKKPEKVKEESEVLESTMRGWIDTIEDAEIAKDIASSEEQTDISLRDPSLNEDAAEDEQYDLQGKPVQPGQVAAPVNAGTSTERFGTAQWDRDHATPTPPQVPTQPLPQEPEQPLQEMPQRLDSFAKQDRNEFVDKSAAQAQKRDLQPFAQHDTFDSMMTKDKGAIIAFDKQGKQIAMISGIVSNRAVVGVKNVFVINAMAAKSGVKGIAYQMCMDLLQNGYSVMSDSSHSDDAIKFWTRLMTNHVVYVVGDGEVLTRAKPEKAHKYWDDDEDSESAELRLLLVK